ncbi:MAG TPA: kelch repeat-containing protein [Bacteroidia bacterium]|nr:kelch repeat-containing protein [Bacteroidia bacterium]
MTKVRTSFFLFLFLAGCLEAQQQYGWIQKAEFGGAARHRVTAESVGNRGYVGLGHINSVVDVLFDDWWEYDPGTDTWTQKANFSGGPRFHCASFVIDNIIYVGTGRDINAVLHQDFWKYDPSSNSWASVASFPGAGRRGAVGFAINGYGYVGTGSGHQNFFRYDPGSDSWLQIASLPGAGRTSAVGFAINGKGYVGTGDIGGPSGDMWEYDPASDTWTAKANLPGLPRMEAGGFVLDGKGYLGTGDDYSSGTNYQDFWCFDPQMNSWTQVADFAGAARRYLSCFTIGNRAYAGLGTSGINYADFWEYGSISGTEEFTQDKTVSVFPDPADQSAEISVENAEGEVSVLVLASDGKCVARQPVVSGKASLDCSGLAPGIYFLQFSVSGKIFSNRKLVVRH